MTWNWAVSGVVEVYNIEQCTDWPGNGAISFWLLNIKLENNDHQMIAKPEWTVTSWAEGLTPNKSQLRRDTADPGNS